MKVPYRFAAYLIKSWIAISLLLSQYLLTAFLRFIFTDNRIYENQYGLFISSTKHLFFSYTLWSKGNNTRRNIRNLKTQLLTVNPTAYFALKKKTVISFAVIVGYVLIVIVVGTLQVNEMIALFDRKSSFNLSNNMMQFACFGCDVNTSPMLEKLFLWFQSAFYPVLSMTVCLLISVPYAISIKLSEELLKDVERSIQIVDFKRYGLDPVRNKLQAVSKFVININDNFDFVIFVFFAVSVLPICFNVTNAILFLECLDYKPLSLAYCLLVYANDIAQVLFLIVLGSKVKEGSDRCALVAAHLSSDAIANGKGLEVQLLLSQLEAYRLELKAGGCFVITKSLILTFLGVVFTYAIVFIQFHSKAFDMLRAK